MRPTHFYLLIFILCASVVNDVHSQNPIEQAVDFIGGTAFNMLEQNLDKVVVAIEISIKRLGQVNGTQLFDVIEALDLKEIFNLPFIPSVSTLRPINNMLMGLPFIKNILANPSLANGIGQGLRSVLQIVLILARFSSDLVKSVGFIPRCAGKLGALINNLVLAILDLLECLIWEESFTAFITLRFVQSFPELRPVHLQLFKVVDSVLDRVRNPNSNLINIIRPIFNLIGGILGTIARILSMASIIIALIPGVGQVALVATTIMGYVAAVLQHRLAQNLLAAIIYLILELTGNAALVNSLVIPQVIPFLPVIG